MFRHAAQPIRQLAQRGGAVLGNGARPFGKGLVCRGNLLAAILQVDGDLVPTESGVGGATVAFFALRADGGFLHIRGGGEHFLRAISERVHFARFRGTSVVTVERFIYPARDGGKRDAGFLPSLDQRPVERGEQQGTPATALEVLFDLGKVIEV